LLIKRFNRYRNEIVKADDEDTMDLITNQLLKARELRDNDGNVRSTSSAQQRKTNQS